MPYIIDLVKKNMSFIISKLKNIMLSTYDNDDEHNTIFGQSDIIQCFEDKSIFKD